MNPILTDRLRLRPLLPSDAPFLFAYLPEVDRFLSLKAPATIAEAENLVAEYLQEQHAGTAMRFAIEDSASGVFVGVVGVYGLNTSGPERHCWIRKDLQSKGYAFEAISAFMEWANECLEYDTMYSSFDAENIAMKRLNEKLGGMPGNDTPVPVLQETGKILNILFYSYKKPV